MKKIITIIVGIISILATFIAGMVLAMKIEEEAFERFKEEHLIDIDNFNSKNGF